MFLAFFCDVAVCLKSHDIDLEPDDSLEGEPSSARHSSDESFNGSGQEKSQPVTDISQIQLDESPQKSDPQKNSFNSKIKTSPRRTLTHLSENQKSSTTVADTSASRINHSHYPSQDPQSRINSTSSPKSSTSFTGESCEDSTVVGLPSAEVTRSGYDIRPIVSGATPTLVAGVLSASDGVICSADVAHPIGSVDAAAVSSSADAAAASGGADAVAVSSSADATAVSGSAGTAAAISSGGTAAAISSGVTAAASSRSSGKPQRQYTSTAL